MRRLLIYGILALLLSSCHSSTKQTTETTDSLRIDSTDLHYPVTIRHAKGFGVENLNGYKKLSLLSPETRDTLAVYLLYPKGTTAPPTSKGAKLIPIPAQSLGSLSSTEVGALPLLQLEDQLVACANTNNISNEYIRQRIQAGKVREISSGMGYNVEQVISIHPDILLLSLSEQGDRDKDLEDAGIGLIPFNNWREQTLLGRAEWIKVLGLLFGRNSLADQVFDHIAQEYQKAKTLIPAGEAPLPIIYGQDYKGSWYVPGEYTYTTAMLQDAGLSYDYISGSYNSQPKSFEYIFEKHGGTALWLAPLPADVKDISEFVKTNERYGHFSATKNGAVWVDRKRVNSHGGNDIWESGVYQPHLLLKDLIKISRPHLLPDYEPTYWFQLSR